MSFTDSLKASLGSRGTSISSFADPTNIADATILKEYGAVFLCEYNLSIGIANANAVAGIATAHLPFPLNLAGKIATGVSLSHTRVKLPNKIIFDDEAEVTAFQSSVSISTKTLGGVTIELQTNAMTALMAAVAQAKIAGLTITPNGDSSAARRSYAKTVEFWDKRIEKGIKHWSKKQNKKGNKLSTADATTLRSLKGRAQIAKVLDLEAKGFYFSTYQNKTILRSVAAPGTSQHLLMLALDVKQHKEFKVRKILAEHGWFQTVYQDHPHFTYLGMPESSLLSLGLTKKTHSSQDFWIP